MENQQTVTTAADVPAVDKRAIEKQSYSKLSYRSLERTRMKGVECGVDIPYLEYPLTGSRKATGALKFLVILTSILIAAGLALALWAAFGLLIPFLNIAFSTSESFETVNRLPIIGLLTGAITFMMWLIVITIPILAIALVVGCVIFLIQLIRICNFTAEEKALGYLLSKVKNGALVFGILLAGAGIALIVLPLVGAVTVSVGGTVLMIGIGVIGLLAAIYAWALFIILQAERNRAKAWVKTLPEAQQANLKEHFKKIALANNRREIRRENRRSGGFRNSKSKWELIFNLIYEYVDVRIIYSNLKKSEYRTKSSTLGLRALYEWFLFVITSPLAVAAFLYVGRNISGGGINILSIIFIIYAVIAVIYNAILTVPMMLNCAIKQLILNKKNIIGWLALILIVASVLALVFAVKYLAGM